MAMDQSIMLRLQVPINKLIGLLKMLGHIIVIEILGHDHLIFVNLIGIPAEVKLYITGKLLASSPQHKTATILCPAKISGLLTHITSPT